MDAGLLCPKCGIELQAELGSRCPLCGTPLQAKPRPDASEKAPPASAVIPHDPSSATTGVLSDDDLDGPTTTTSGWSVEVPPVTNVGVAPRLPASGSFTPMPSLVASTSLPPPPFLGGAAGLRPASSRLPGPPVLGNVRASDPDPDSAVTAVMAGPPMPAAQPLVIEDPRDDDDEDAVDAATLEITATGPGASVPLSEPVSAAPATLSPTRVPLRTPARAEPPTGPIAVARPSPVPTVAQPAPESSRAARPRRTRGVLLFLVALVAIAGAFYAGRVTAPAAMSPPTALSP